MVPSVRISSAEKLRREKEVEDAVGVCCERSMEATGVRVFDDDGEEEAELRFRRKEKKERVFEEEEEAETAESLFETATRGEDGQ